MKLMRRVTDMMRNLTRGMIILTMIVSCAPSAARHEQAQVESPATFTRLLVLPFVDMAQAFGENAGVRSPISGKMFVAGRLAIGAVDTMTGVLLRGLQQQFPDRRVSLAEHAIITPAMTLGMSAQAELIDAVQKAGRDNHADVVMLGFVYDYKERVGRDYGIEAPASISFELNLVDTNTGRLLWQWHFTETQQSLDQNLFHLKKFLQRKGRWITAREMAANAVGGAMEYLSEKYH
jgi:hypothetical protein